MCDFMKQLFYIYVCYTEQIKCMLCNILRSLPLIYKFQTLKYINDHHVNLQHYFVINKYNIEMQLMKLLKSLQNVSFIKFTVPF